MSTNKDQDSLALLAYGGSKMLDKDIKHWRNEVKRQKPGTLMHDLAKSTLAHLLELKKLK